MITNDITSLAQQYELQVSEKKGKLELTRLVAERKAFLSSKKLNYTAWVGVDEANKAINFSEMLKESGSGLSSGDGNTSPGFGFKVESYNTTSGAREGGIEEQSNLFGKQYTYQFDFAKVRKEIEQLAQQNGYSFTYHITPKW